MFKRSQTSYGETPAPSTPYQKAAQVWDERMGSARVQAKNWRLMAFGCLFLAAGASGALLWRSMQSTVTPYVVEVSELGEVRAIGPAADRYEPTDAQIAHHLAGLLQNVRGLSVDPIIVRQNWLTAYSFVMGEASTTLDDYARTNDPFADIGARSRTIEVSSIVRLTDDSFQARWTEKVYQRGTFINERDFTAILGVTITPPVDAETLRANPLGLYVTHLNWGQDLSTGVQQ